jgi:hypothetical protein
VTLMESVRNTARRKHLADATEKRYTYWIRRFILYHGKRHPLTMGRQEIEAFLTGLAVQRRLSAGSQSQALAAILFLYREVLERDIEFKLTPLRAHRTEHLRVKWPPASGMARWEGRQYPGIPRKGHEADTARTLERLDRLGRLAGSA